MTSHMYIRNVNREQQHETLFPNLLNIFSNTTMRIKIVVHLRNIKYIVLYKYI